MRGGLESLLREQLLPLALWHLFQLDHHVHSNWFNCDDSHYRYRVGESVNPHCYQSWIIFPPFPAQYPQFFSYSLSVVMFSYPQLERQT